MIVQIVIGTEWQAYIQERIDSSKLCTVTVAIQYGPQLHCPDCSERLRPVSIAALYVFNIILKSLKLMLFSMSTGYSQT